MKWVYNSPDPQVLVSDQKNLWLYAPEEEQVTKMPIESVYSSNTPALFLAGQGILTDIFNVVQVLTEKDKFVAVFTPKEVESSLSRLCFEQTKITTKSQERPCMINLVTKLLLNFDPSVSTRKYRKAFSTSRFLPE